MKTLKDKAAAWAELEKMSKKSRRKKNDCKIVCDKHNVQKNVTIDLILVDPNSFTNECSITAMRALHSSNTVVTCPCNSNTYRLAGGLCTK